MRTVYRDTRVKWHNPTAELLKVITRTIRYKSIKKNRNERNK
jgi:hypothetical protein